VYETQVYTYVLYSGDQTAVSYEITVEIETTGDEAVIATVYVRVS
jgi:hypothetical protein